MAGNPYRETVPGVDLADVQGNILRGYRMGYVRHLVMRVTDGAAARASLGALVDGTLPTQVTSASPWKKDQDKTPRDCLNVGITFAGLRALGVSKSSLKGFPTEFRAGMAARAARLGDVGASAPERWDTRLAEADDVHVIFTVHGKAPHDVDRACAPLQRAKGFWFIEQFDGAALPDDTVHFGYRDGIAQPRFIGVHDPDQFRDRQPLVPLGAALLGHPTPFPGVRWRVPDPPALGHNGAFNAFRVLAQDVAAFESYLKLVEKEHDLPPERTAAKLCGRWRNGVPLILASDPPDPPADDDRSLDDFDYDDDPIGVVCPLGAHIRRANPRSSPIVQRGLNHTRQVVRRGMPYGPLYDPGKPEVPRGLLGNFICASLAAQFEAVQGDWLNLGLHDPRLSGSNDPLTGANGAEASRFETHDEVSRPIVLRELPNFVVTRGGAYTFLPSLTALRWIAALPGS